MTARVFFDWHIWTVGLELWLFGDLHRADDRLGQTRTVIICLGPLIIASAWPV